MCGSTLPVLHHPSQCGFCMKSLWYGLWIMTRVLIWPHQRAAPPHWMVNGAARWRPYLQRNREMFLQSLLSNNRPRCGAALRLCGDPKQMAALRGSGNARVAFRVPYGRQRKQFRCLRETTERTMEMETDCQDMMGTNLSSFSQK